MILVYQYNSSLSVCYVTCVWCSSIKYSVQVQKFVPLIGSALSKSRRVFDIGVREVPFELLCLFTTNKSPRDCIRSPHIP